MTVHFEGDDAPPDARVEVVDMLLPDGSACNEAWAFVDQSTHDARYLCVSAEAGAVALSDGTHTDVFAGAADGSVTLNGKPLEEPPDALFDNAPRASWR